MNIIDSHFHIWRLARGDYAWLTPALGDIHRDVSVLDWQRVAEPLGVRAGVLVQAAPTEAETQFLLSVADAEACVLGVIGWADLLAPDACRRIADLALHPKLKGLRPMLQDIADPDWILQPGLVPALRAMVEHDLAFDALVHPQHLTRIRELARRHPDLRIVIDHAGKPEIAQGRWQAWANDLRLVADETAALCKFSGLLTQAQTSQASVLAPWLCHVLKSFGPARVLWGSDWPVLELAGCYESWWNLSYGVCARFTASEREAVFGGNARLVYRLSEGTERSDA